MVDPEMYVSSPARLRYQRFITVLARLVVAACALGTAAGLGVALAWAIVGRPQ